MPVRPLRHIGDPVLRRPTTSVESAAVTSPEIQSLIADLVDTMDDANGSGIAANQIGVSVA
ncbi:MAG: peptide deformylase, partial [Acidimicrobiia bacterium]|nr:peptide deformylase [Acidimicrobiia bacterium]